MSIADREAARLVDEALRGGISFSLEGFERAWATRGVYRQECTEAPLGAIGAGFSR